MIGYDDVDSGLPRRLNRLVRGYAAVHGHDQLNALLGEGTDPLRVEAIPLLQTIRNVVDRIQPCMTQKVDQDGRAGQPVDVVVSIDENPFFLFDRLEESIHRPTHPPKQGGGTHLPERGGKKPFGFIHIADSPTIQDL